MRPHEIYEKFLLAVASLLMGAGLVYIAWLFVSVLYLGASE